MICWVILNPTVPWVIEVSDGEGVFVFNATEEAENTIVGIVEVAMVVDAEKGTGETEERVIEFEKERATKLEKENNNWLLLIYTC